VDLGVHPSLWEGEKKIGDSVLKGMEYMVQPGDTADALKGHFCHIIECQRPMRLERAEDIHHAVNGCRALALFLGLFSLFLAVLSAECATEELNASHEAIQKSLARLEKRV
jgi:hypothetical protein